VPAVTEELPIDTIHQKICSKKDRINYWVISFTTYLPLYNLPMTLMYCSYDN
jgi:hypothetical protein